VVTTQVFYATKLSAALVNLKPILPGHSLVIPRRVVPRYTDLSPDEVAHITVRF
jgi:bis(5'-adenosyl)-triphosphatase